MKFFLPKQPIFFDYFRDLNKCITDITAVLSDFSLSFKDADRFFVRANQIEQDADKITHDIIHCLNTAFITPFDREDLYDLAQKMDDVVDTIEHTMQRFYMYHVTEKKMVMDSFVALTVKASHALDRLVHECFVKQKQTKTVHEWIVKIHDFEDEADVFFRKAMYELFSDEKNPITVMQWKDLLERLEDIMNKFQLVSVTMEGIIVKSN